VTLEKLIENMRGETVRISPCSNPDHIAKFEAGYAVVSCNKCVMEIVPGTERSSSAKGDES
jgi:hypothetical protein